MVDTKFSALTAAGAVAAGDQVALIQGGVSKVATAAQLKTFSNDVATDAIWDAAGDIVRGTGADTAGRLAITVPAANILNVLGVVNGETNVSWKSVHDATVATTQALGDAATAGTSLLSSHADHKHAMPTKADLYSQSVLGTADTAIANTETIVTARVFAANELVAGQVYKFEAWFTKAGTNAASAVIRIRIGTTTLTGTIMGTLTPPSNALAVPGKIEGLLRIVTDGAGGTARGELSQQVHLAAVTITSAINPSTATGAVNTTTANQRVELTFISGHASNTYTFRNAVMYRVA